MFQWYSKNDKKGVATIYPTNITINKIASAYLQNAYACLLGIDQEEKQVALTPLTQDQYQSGRFNPDEMFVLSGSKTYIRISSTDFVSQISHLLGQDFHKGNRKYECSFDEKERLLIIDLRKEMTA